MMNNSEILTANKIVKTIIRQANAPEIKILQGINLTVHQGEFLSILGPSGSGKTTLLRCLSGLMQPTSGQVHILNQNLYQLSDRKLAQLRRKEISYIFQSYNLLPALPVYDNIVLPLRLGKQKVQPQKVSNLLVELNFTADLKQFPGRLSGGEQQKVAIARALMMDAQIIFADEPTGALDSISRQLIFDQLKKLVDRGVCVIMVTHDIELASKTDRALILQDGQIIQEFMQPTEAELLQAMTSKEGAS